MRKTVKRLTLNRETVCQLEDHSLRRAAGQSEMQSDCATVQCTGCMICPTGGGVTCQSQDGQTC
jgi:hypothetical protein